MSLRLLFVCLGNICRSPLAQGYAIHHAQTLGLDLVCDSAGTSDFHEGEPPCKKIIKAALQHGLDLSMQRSRPITSKDQDHFTHLIALDEAVAQELRRRGYTKITKLGDYGYHGACVPDPYYLTHSSDLEQVISMVDNAVLRLLEELSSDKNLH